MVNRMAEDEPLQQPLKGLRTGYIGLSVIGTLPRHACKVPRVVCTHNTVEDKRQRPTTEVGGVYSYEAIAAGTRLRCELRLRASFVRALENVNPDWRQVLADRVRLGRSKKDDFGLVRIELASSLAPASSDLAGVSGLLVVWLLSDALLRNSQLRSDPSPEALRLELEARLKKVSLTLKPELGDRLSAFVRTRRIESWHVGWGLPRPSLIAMAAGSCLVFQVECDLDRNLLGQVESEGIGDRRAEGYGRIAFNDPLLLEVLQGWNAQSEFKPGVHIVLEESAGGIGDNSVGNFEVLIEREAWRTAIRRHALGFAAKESNRRQHLGFESKEKRPPMSQLGAFRTVVQRMRSTQDATVVLAWLKNLAERPNRRDKWPGRSLSLINDLLTVNDRVWSLLASERWPTLTEGATARLKAELWPEAIRAVVDTCVRAHKRETE